MPVTLHQIESKLYTVYFNDLSPKEKKVLPNTITADLNNAEKEFGNTIMVDDILWKVHRWLQVYNWKEGKAVGEWRKKYRGIVNKLRRIRDGNESKN